MTYNNYTARTLFTGFRLGLKNGKLYVGVPNTKGANIVVTHKGQKMTITNMEGLEHWGDWLPDKAHINNGNDYRLGYYEWNPDENG